jgi:hypothetical protein
MSTGANDLDFPDISRQKGPSYGSFLSVRGDNAHIGVSNDLVEDLGLESGDVAVLAFDDEGRPWVGFLMPDMLDDPREHGPQVRVGEESGNAIYSVPMQTQLQRFATDGERRRLYLSAESRDAALDDGIEVTMHRFVPEETGEDVSEES